VKEAPRSKLKSVFADETQGMRHSILCIRSRSDQPSRSMATHASWGG
jgi:hypothetical protein